MSHTLVFDLGTTNFKASIFDDTADLVALETAPTPISATGDRCEIDSVVFRDTIVHLAKALPDEERDRVSAVTFATQTNSFVLLDENNNSLTPIILWPDERARDSFAPILPDRFQEITGVPALNHQFLAAKLQWLRDSEPAVTVRTRRFCLISDYLTLWLTGRNVTEAGAAGLTGLLDIHRRAWWDEPCTQFGVPRLWLPEVASPGANVGPLLPECANELGLSKACRVFVGCLDQYAGAIGAGNVTPGAVSETTGTVLATVRCSDSFVDRPAEGVFQGPAYKPGLYYKMAFGDTSGNLLEQYRAALPDSPPFGTLIAEAADVAPGAMNRPQTNRGEAVRAILERVAFALRHQTQALCGDAFPARMTCLGGAARSDAWLQIKANVLNVPMTALECPEPTSLGAALIAIAARNGEDLADVTARYVQPERIIEPQQEIAAIYATMVAN